VTRILVADDDRTTRLLISEILRAEKFTVVCAPDGAEALKKLKEDQFDLALLDVWMPKKNGIEVLAALRKSSRRPKAIVMTSDDTPETLLGAIREQAYQYVSKPVEPAALIALVKQSLEERAEALPIEVVSARPEWVELLVPCSLESAERIESFMTHLKGGLPEDVRSAVGHAFHELLLNAVEWGGKLDAKRKVRISYLRAKRMLLYRIADPGPGFKLADLSHAAISNSAGDPTKHDEIRQQKGLRPGGFGLILARANVDELLYNEAQNEVVFVKYLESATASRGTDVGE
jgi:CheY-like chemotaxis protein/anti-sigma regulatory factor (Ser/Thr protein kinase)